MAQWQPGDQDRTPLSVNVGELEEEEPVSIAVIFRVAVQCGAIMIVLSLANQAFTVYLLQTHLAAIAGFSGALNIYTDCLLHAAVPQACGQLQMPVGLTQMIWMIEAASILSSWAIDGMLFVAGLRAAAIVGRKRTGVGAAVVTALFGGIVSGLATIVLYNTFGHVASTLIAVVITSFVNTAAPGYSIDINGLISQAQGFLALDLTIGYMIAALFWGFLGSLFGKHRYVRDVARATREAAAAYARSGWEDAHRPPTLAPTSYPSILPEEGPVPVYQPPTPEGWQGASQKPLPRSVRPSMLADANRPPYPGVPPRYPPAQNRRPGGNPPYPPGR